MNNKKSFLQKIIIIVFLLIIIISLIQPTVQAIVLPGRYSNLEDGYNTIRNFRDNNGNNLPNAGSHFYIWTDSNGTRHIVALTELESLAGDSNARVFGVYSDNNVDLFGTYDSDVDAANQYISAHNNGQALLTWTNPNATPEQTGGTPGANQGSLSDLAERQQESDEASRDDDENNGLGGVLFNPILDFVVTIGDVVINALQVTLLEPDKLNDSNVFAIGKYLIQSDKASELNNNSGGSQDSGATKIDTTINVDTSKFAYGWLNLKKTFYYIKAKYSPEEIFSNTSTNNKVPAFNINFFSNVTAQGNATGAAEQMNNLRKVIAGWYVALRNLSIVGLLCVLVYLGIRIVISASAADKAKYKQLIIDWLIALCLLFTMHYIMAFTVTIVEAIVNGISRNSTSVSITGERN